MSTNRRRCVLRVVERGIHHDAVVAELLGVEPDTDQFGLVPMDVHQIVALVPQVTPDLKQRLPGQLLRIELAVRGPIGGDSDDRVGRAPAMLGEVRHERHDPGGHDVRAHLGFAVSQRRDWG